jgi:hypothetical protein
MSRSFPQALAFFLILGFISFAMPQHSFGASTAQITWPGQSGNAVGYAAAPGWPGSFNTTACSSSPASGSSWSNATVVSNCTYSSPANINCNYCIFEYVDFNGGTTVSAQIGGSHILFLGDRFQSNDVQGGNIGVTGSYIYFLYDSVVPLASFYTSPPGYTTWPSAGAGANTTTQTSGVNSVAGSEGYEYGINLASSTGPFWIDHNDIWGFGNAINLNSGSTQPVVVTSNWIHDAAYAGTEGYHTDVCPGYLNGATAPSNVTVIGNVCASLGSNEAMPFQAATGGYQNMYVAENFLAGQTTIVWCHPGSVQCTNSYLYGNQFSTIIMNYGTVYDNGATIGSGSEWACNTIDVTSGTNWTNLDGWTPSSSENGDFLINNSNGAIPYSTTDQGGNTICGVPAPSSINFGNQSANSSSGGQTITLSNTNTATLSISSVALATGTQFSISSNSCGATLSSGSSCSITVQFSPTSMGPQTDTLLITDNTPGVTSPQLVPLVGIGITGSTVAAPTGLTAQVQ